MDSIIRYLNLRQLKQTIIVMLVLLTGCTEEHITPPNLGGNTELPGGRVAYSFHTESADLERPVTRTGTADENNATGDMWIFVFDASTTDTLFLEVVKTSEHEPAAAGASKRTAILQTRAHKVTVAVLDNVPTHYYPGSGTTDIAITDAASWGLTPGVTKLSEARMRLNTVRIGAPSVNMVPYTPSLKIALSTEVHRDKLDASIEFGTESSPLGLKRAVARLTVKKDYTGGAGNASTPPFILKGATVYNTSRNASLFPVHQVNAGNLTNYTGTGVGNEITGIAAATDDDTEANPIYLYPSAESSTANQPFVLIQAQFDADAQDTYYKLAIAPAGKPAGRVERNAAYRLLIKECTGRGYATIDEAIAAPLSNVIIYNMEVTDLTSHDILDNGQYFLAFSNSEYMFFLTGAATDLTVTTLSYKKTTGVTGSVTITDVRGGTNPNPTITRNPFTVFDATDNSEDLNMTFPATFKSCTLVVHYGNLTQRIPITRQHTLPSAPIVQTQFAGIGADYVYGTVEYPSLNMTRWIGLSTDNNPFTEGTDKLSRDTKGGFYLKLVSNNYADQDPEDRKATIYLSRPTGKGRLRLYLKQDGINMSKLNDTSDPGFIPVVGAFWRAKQTGERLVQITKSNITGAVSLDGYWYTTNVYYGDNWDPDNGDGVLVDNLPSTDPAIWTAGGPTKSGNDTGFDTDYPVSKSQFAEGEMTPDPARRIYFRIGLEKPYTSTAAFPARYALVVLAYTANGSEMRYHRMFIRQGEEADYLMRPQDKYGNYGQALTNWGTPNPVISLWGWASGPEWRPYAKKFLPYNLRATDWNTATQSLPLRKDETTFNKNKLTDYPTQGGYHFRFSGVEGSAQQVGASTQTQPLGIWDASKSETCPVGYRRFEDGISTTTRNNSRALADNSELRQSLWLSPGFGNASNSENGINSLKGYYADGYFDRRLIVNAITDKSAVAYGTSQVAYQGYLMFNPNNYASLFFPLAGRRGKDSAALELTGGYGIYWSSTVTNNSGPGASVIDDSGSAGLGNEPFTINIGISGYGGTTGVPGVTSWYYARGGSVRCVKDE